MTSDYRAAKEGAAFYILPDPGYLRLHGADRRSFLQRQTTNDVSLLQPDKIQLTVLTSAVARILDVLVLLGQNEGVAILTLPARGAATAQFLQSRIFFNDDVELTDLSHQYVHILLMGPRVEGKLTKWDLQPPQNRDVGSGNLRGIPIHLMRQPLWPHPVYRLLIPHNSTQAMIKYLQQEDVTLLSEDVFTILRLEAGVPGPQGELTENYTPLEIGLNEAISDSKGCYTGQEVIARQLTYDKVTRKMVGLKLEQGVEIGQSVYGQEKKIGEITSLARSPKFGWIALAVIKRPFFEQTIRVSVAEPESGIRAQISSLPF